MSDTPKQATVELLGERRLKVYQLREEGLSYVEIGRRIGVSPGRARDIRKDAEYILRQGPHWTDGLPQRTASLLVNHIGFRSREEVMEVYQNGRLTKYRNLGRKAYSEIRKWLGFEDDWHAGLSNRVVNVLVGMGINSREQAMEQFKAMMLQPGGPRNFGVNSFGQQLSKQTNDLICY